MCQLTSNKVDQKKKEAEKTNEGQVLWPKTLYIHISLHSADINHP